MKILAVIDVHPLDGKGRGLFVRVASGSSYFDMPITKDQAGVLLSKVEALMDPMPASTQRPPTVEEHSLFAQFTSDMNFDASHDDDDDDDDDDGAL